MLIPYIKFQDPVSNRSSPYAKRNGQTDAGRDGQTQINMPRQRPRR